MQGNHYEEDSSDTAPISPDGNVQMLVPSQTGLVSADDLYRDTYFNPDPNNEHNPDGEVHIIGGLEDGKDVKTFVV